MKMGDQSLAAPSASWGALNAITEYCDHHQDISDGSRLAYALLGNGMDLKIRAFQLIQEQCRAAA
ncbi:MAG TPA: hypothetical protein P5552_02525 [Candidatus Competibacteraceae bacterium]|nr:hypothetical protein [Candidatus Competibacteraceae bacterium]